MSVPRVSFVIPVFNRLDLTRAFVVNLASTVPASLSWDAVIVDDASTDDTARFLEKLAPPFRAVRMPTNSGFARAANAGVRATDGPIVGFLNNDLILRPGWLEPMLHLLETAPEAGAVGNIQMNPATGLVDHAGVFFDPSGMPTHAHKNRRRPPSGRWRERNAATAACMLVPRAAFESLGGFCEEFRNGMEDIDLCVGLKQAGHRIYVSHESVVSHLVSSSPGRHAKNDANSALFRQRCASIAAPWGRSEWPAEYFRRYARFWWRMNPGKVWLALRMLAGFGPP